MRKYKSAAIKALVRCEAGTRGTLVMSHWTIQLLIDCDILISAHCRQQSCDGHQELSLVRLKEKLGPDASAMHQDLAPRYRCAKCGNDKIELSYSPKDQRTARLQVANRYNPLNLLIPADVNIASAPPVGSLGANEGA